MFLAGTLGLFLAASSPSGLGPLVLEGHELHSSLKTRQFDDHPVRHVPYAVLGANPYHSTDAEFVRAIVHSGSQGELGVERALSALRPLLRRKRAWILRIGGRIYSGR